MSRYYKLLEDGTTVPTDHLEIVGDNHVAEDQVGDSYVSTVFLYIDHDHLHEGSPILFETMVFGGPYDNDMERYCTIQEAREGHARWVERVTPVQVPAPPPPVLLSFSGKRKIKFDQGK